ncbi:protein SERAC1 [Marchantia polymorpha subsp. ruderalis]
MKPRTQGADRKSRSGSLRNLTTMYPRTTICGFLLAVLLFYFQGFRSPVPRLQEIEPSSARSFRESGWKQKSDSVHELSSASEKRTDVVFFHGLRLGPAHEAHLSSWKSRSKTGEVWLMWLHEDNPSLRILAVSYDASMKKDSKNGRMDIFQVSENLLQELIMARVGKTGPVIFVGHSFGGIIAKEICRQAHLTRSLGENIPAETTLLHNLRGLFFFGVPHSGSSFTDVLEEINFEKGELVDYVKVFSKDLARLNHVFDRLCEKYEWRVAGVGESLPTLLPNGFSGVIVDEASARYRDFIMVNEDHFSICQPASRTSTSYLHLVNFIDEIHVKVRNTATDEQELPKIHVQRSVKRPDLGCLWMEGGAEATILEALFYCLLQFIKDWSLHKLQNLK